MADLKRVGERAVTPGKISFAFCLPLQRYTLNVFQGICFVVPHSTRVCIRTRVVAVWKEVGELQIVSTSLL